MADVDRKMLNKLRRNASINGSSPSSINRNNIQLLDQFTSESLTSEDAPSANRVRLERSASQLSRSIAYAKLTGSPPPLAPPSYYTSPASINARQPMAPLPTLEELRERAAKRLMAATSSDSSSNFGGDNIESRPAGIKRSNTVTGSERSYTERGYGQVMRAGQAGEDSSATQNSSMEVLMDKPVLDRAEARVNLMRKLSLRRTPDTTSSTPTTPSIETLPPIIPRLASLAVGGREGMMRPRSGSLGNEKMYGREDTPRRRPGFEGSYHRVPIIDRAPLSTPPPPHQTSLAPALSLVRNSSPIRAWNPDDEEIERSENTGDEDGKSYAGSMSTTKLDDDDDDDETTFAYTPQALNSENTPRFFNDFEWTKPASPLNQLSPSVNLTVPSPQRSRSHEVEISPPGSPVESNSSLNTSSSDVPLILRRGSIPQHVLAGASRFPSSMSTMSSLAGLDSQQSRAQKTGSFGNAVVEEDVSSNSILRRGPSTSSSFTGVSNVRRRGSEMIDLNASTSSLGLRDSDADEGVRMRSDSIDTVESFMNRPMSMLGSSLAVGGEESRRGSIVSGSGSGSGESYPGESILAAKVEMNRVAGAARSRDGAFPPPEADYQFPSPVVVVSSPICSTFT